MAAIVATSYDGTGGKTVDRILDMGIDVNDATGLKSGENPLYMAIITGQWETAMKFLHRGADLYTRVCGRNLLHWAVSHEDCFHSDTTLLPYILPLLRKADEDDENEEATRYHTIPLSLFERACCNRCRTCIGLLLACGTVSKSELSDRPLELLFDNLGERPDYLWPVFDCFRILVAYGCRLLERPSDIDCVPELAMYDSVVAATDACGDAALAILSVARLGGRIHGNNRDVLRLVAKEVWLSRMHDDWFNARQHKKR